MVIGAIDIPSGWDPIARKFWISTAEIRSIGATLSRQHAGAHNSAKTLREVKTMIAPRDFQPPRLACLGCGRAYHLWGARGGCDHPTREPNQDTDLDPRAGRGILRRSHRA